MYGVAVLPQTDLIKLTSMNPEYAGKLSRVAAPAFLAISNYWAKELGLARSALMNAVVSLTYLRGRVAGAIPLSVFCKGETYQSGMPWMRFGGTGMDPKTARKHLSWLTERGFLLAFQAKSSVENSIKAFAINCKMLLETLQNERGLTKNLITHLGKFPSAANIYTYIDSIYSYLSVGLNKFKRLSPPSGTADLVEEIEVLPTPKKVRPTRDRVESVAQVIQLTTSAHKEKEAGRAAAVSVKKPAQIQATDMQALLDLTMREYMPGVPRLVVTGKEFGVMRKRLAQYEITNVADFIRWTIRNWTSIATQNRNAARRDSNRKGTPIDAVPTFKCLAYVMPYFVRVYANSKGQEVTVKEDSETKVLRQRLARAEADARAKDQMIRRMGQRASEPRKPVTTRTRPALRQNDDILEDDWTPPEWTGSTTRR